MLFLAAACTDLGSFSTSTGECYHGQIVAADFVRAGFETDVTLYLTLDVTALSDGRGSAGVISTSDGRFYTASISQMEQLAHDSISLFQFPGGRIRNYMAHAFATDGAPASIVISLMEDGKVEVRIVRPAGAGDLEYSELFGVFSTSIDEECSAPYGQSAFSQDPVLR